MFALTYTIELHEPVLATQPYSGEANSASSYAYIPGSMVRGACIRAFQQTHKLRDLADDRKGRRDLFFADSVRFLNAYPAHPKSGNRLLPTPRAWFVEKGNENKLGVHVYDFSQAETTTVKKPKPPDGLFCELNTSGVVLHKPLRQEQVHNANQNRNEKRAGSSQVFRYEALAAGQRLVGLVLAEDLSALQDIAGLLPQVLLLGGSHTGGYGRVAITANPPESWSGNEAPPGTPPQKQVIVTLLSPAIVRGANGHPAADLAQLCLVTPQAHYRAFTELELVGGFNRYWGLPLPQTWALAAGSVFCFAIADVDMGKLQKLAQDGMGERRNEGYGRIALNWHTQSQYMRQEIKSPKPPRVELHDTAAQPIAQRMAQRKLRADLEQGLLRGLNVTAVQFQRLPSATQLSRLRVAVRQAQARGDLSIIANHLKNLKGAKSEWQQARYGGESLYQWVLDQTELSDAAFQRKFLSGKSVARLRDVEAALEPALKAEYITRLIDGVLKLAVTQARAEKEGHSHG